LQTLARPARNNVQLSDVLIASNAIVAGRLRHQAALQLQLAVEFKTAAR
jgi:hypothetical protein